MNFDQTDRARQWSARLRQFMQQHIYPNEELYQRQANELGWAALPIVEELKQRARAEGLWNLFMPPAHGTEQVDDTFRFEAPGLTNPFCISHDRTGGCLIGRDEHPDRNPPRCGQLCRQRT
jgi:acyl-CoA dehydrogenase